MDLTRPDRARREYPEVSFAVVGAIVSGLIGVSVGPVAPGREAALLAYATNAHVMTLAQLTTKTAWAELRHLRARANDPTIRHEGLRSTDVTNNRGPAIVWQAAFAKAFDELLVSGASVKATRLTVPDGRVVNITRVVVAPGETIQVVVRD
jgi:hypothetical protein